MSGFDQWLSGGVGAVASAMPVWLAGAAAALLFFVGVLAFGRAAQAGRAGIVWRGALVVVGAGLMWAVTQSLGARDPSMARHALDARAAELTLRALAPGSPLACLEAAANDTVETACERVLFASPQTVAAAAAFIDARLSLLADSLEFAKRDRNYEASTERLRRSIEADRFGVVAHVLATRGCTLQSCEAFKLLRDPRQVAANLRERTFDSNVILHAQAWAAPATPAAPSSVAAPVAAAPAAPQAPALASVPGVTTTGAAPPPGGARYDFPSSASIPAISIMNAEPPLAPGESANVPSAPASAAPSGAARPPAQRRPAARETPPAQQQAGPPPAAVPLPPPGTIANPR